MQRLLHKDSSTLACSEAVDALIDCDALLFILPGVRLLSPASDSKPHGCRHPMIAHRVKHVQIVLPEEKLVVIVVREDVHPAARQLAESAPAREQHNVHLGLLR